jgi:hypothetical protein
MGEFERGTELSRRAQQLNPLHPSWYYFSFARLHDHQEAYEKVISDVHTSWKVFGRLACASDMRRGRRRAADHF